MSLGSSRDSLSAGGLSTLAEMNITPLVDVILVLLIIFMISAPMMQQGIQVNLPQTSAGALTEVSEQFVLVIQKSHDLLLANHKVTPELLLKKLKALSVAHPEIEIVIQADQNVSYGFVAQVIAEVKKVGISRIGLATEFGKSTFFQ